MLPGEALQELILKNGSMEAVNARFERQSVEEHEEDEEGAWHTEGSLVLVPGWIACKPQHVFSCLFANLSLLSFASLSCV